LIVLFFGIQALFSQTPKALCPAVYRKFIPVDNKISKLKTLGNSIVYSHGEPTDEEQLMLEYINRARANPKAEGERIAATQDPDILSSVSYFKINLSQIKSEFAGYPVRPPIAMNEQLINAARKHCEDMSANDFQDHTGSDGSSPFQRMNKAGYPGGEMGENIFAYMKSVLYGHLAFNIDWGNPGLGHRHNLMAFGSNDAVFREVGIGIIKGNGGSTGPLICTQDYGNANDYFVLGVVYKDKNKNNFYDIGEGLPGVSITLNQGSYSAITSKSGGYAIPLGKITGSVVITASGGGMVENQTKTISVKKNVNVKVDFGNQATNDPYLLSPNDNSNITTDTVKCIWQKNNFVPTTFKFECAKDIDFTQIVYIDSNKIDTSKVLKGLTLYQSYYWRVQAKSQFGYSDFSPIYTFKYSINPSKVSLVEPISGYVTLKDTISFGWLKASPNIQSYYLEVYDDSSLSTFYTFKTNILDTTVIIKDFDYGKKYYWRVKAKNNGGFGDWSEINWFQYGAAPSIISNMMPPNGSSIPLNKAKFSWGATNPPAEKYWFEIYDDSTLKSIPAFFLTRIIDTMTTVNDEWGLKDGTNYWWRVKGISGNLSGTWSSLYKISIGLYQSAPVNLLPKDGVTMPINGTRFSWGKSTPSSDKYWFEIWEDSTMKSTPTYFSTSITSTYKDVASDWGLTDKKTYWWRVKGIIGTLWGKWSDVKKISFDNSSKSVKNNYNDFKFEINPNIINKNLTIKFNSDKINNFNYSIINSSGNIIKTDLINSIIVNNIFNINVDNFPSGKYSLNVTRIDGTIYSGSFIIIK
ncbi:MAG: CAP domain-containing protein, partial [Candidatus Kapaibacterium sp.]